MKQYLLSVHHTGDYPTPPEEDMQRMFTQVDAFNQQIVESGAWVFGGGLHPRDTATTVRFKEGQTLVTDGPYAETKEFLGGFAVVDVDDDETAKMWAGRLAEGCGWPQEVRRFGRRPQAG